MIPVFKYLQVSNFCCLLLPKHIARQNILHSYITAIIQLRLKKLTFKFKAIKLHFMKSYQIYNKSPDFSMFSFLEAKIEFLA